MQNKTISVKYTPFAQIIADSLIKALSSIKWQTFLDQMGLSNGIIYRLKGSAKDKVKKLTSSLEELYS
jgi:hypothetical protein